MNRNSTLKSFVNVVLSNISTIVSGVLVAFILPRILPIIDYGYYKTFTLYTTYAGLLSLGVIDGIVLLFGEKNYEQLDKQKFRSYFKWYLIIHIILSSVVLLFSLIFLKNEYRIIFCFLSLYIISNNITGYFQQISQITLRFKEYSFRRILQSVLNILIVLVLYCLFRMGIPIGYKLYILLFVTMNIILTLWYVKTYKKIVFGKSMSLYETKNDIKELIIVGFPLLFANLCSTLILTLDRQFVNILFTTEEYGVYAFAYNMLSLVTVATSAISTILYPTMKRTSKELLSSYYSTMISMILLSVYGVLTVYFPLSSFVNWFLPKYSESIIIFKIIFPGLAISSAITVVMHNFYKVYGDNLLYFKKSVIVLVISAIANYIAYIIWGTTLSISIASIFTMLLWYVYIDRYFVDKFDYKCSKNLLYLITMLILFYISTYFYNDLIGMILYLILYSIITFQFFKKDFKMIRKILKK